MSARAIHASTTEHALTESMDSTVVVHQDLLGIDVKLVRNFD